MVNSSGPRSPLYHRLRLIQRVFPLVASIPIIIYETFEHGIQTQPIAWEPFAVEILVYGVIVPVLVFLTLNWLLRRVRERDEAEARLSALYEISSRSASASGLEDLHDLAMTIPERVGLAGASASLTVQDAPGGPWLLVGTRCLGSQEIAALDAGLTSAQLHPGCDRCNLIASPPQSDCPLLGAIRAYAPDAPQAAYCLSLSRDNVRQVVLTVYLPDEAKLPAQVVETLESMGAGLAVALDRARLRERQRQLLHQVERDVRTEQLGLVPTLQRILADIAAEHSIAAGAVYLIRRNDAGQFLAPAACWPGPQAGTMLAEKALDAVQTTEELALARPVGPDPTAPSAQVLTGRGVAAVPITSEGQALGVLVLAEEAGPADAAGGCLPDPSILGVVTSVMALLIRNSQLYSQLESQAVLEERSHLAAEVHDGLAQSLGFLNVKIQQVQRLLARGQVAEAAAALQELRDGSQELYAEVRGLIQGLRWTRGDQGGLAQRLQQYGSAFAARTGLEVTVEVGVEPDLPPDAQLQLFRVVQEALNNVQQHAHARRVTVRLSEGPDGVALTVKDDGAGLQPPDRESGGHFGLRIMRERVQSIGAELEIESRPSAGTGLYIRVPTGTAGERRKEELWSTSVS